MTSCAGDCTPSRATVEWALRALGGRAVSAVTLVRAGSTAVHLLDVALHGGGEARFVLRRFVDRERLGTDPWYVPRHEAAALELLDRVALPTPRLLAADVEGTSCDAPALLTTHLPGRAGGAQPAPDEDVLTRLAEPLPLIHGAGGEGVARLPSYAPYYRPGDVTVPAWSQEPRVWRRALELAASGRPPEGRPRLIHRDYHPGNTLWTGRRLTGVVDWTTACTGPPGVDLARMRQNLARLHGAAAAGRFLAAYVRVTGRAEDRHPWWDLVDAVDMLADTPAPAGARQARALREWEAYVAGVLSELPRA